MTEVQMTAGVTTGDQFETVHYPDDEILLRVTGGGNVQVIEYEGEVEFYVNGQWTRGGPGTVQMLPAGASHSVRVPEGKARLLYITMGPPYDGMARELSALYAAGDVDPQGILKIALRHGLRLEGDNSIGQS